MPVPLSSMFEMDIENDRFLSLSYAGGVFMVTWEAIYDPDAEEGAYIYVARSLDGMSFEPPQRIASELVAADSRPDLAGNGENWVVAWHAHPDLGGTTGTDGDINYVWSNDGGVTWSEIGVINDYAVRDSSWDGQVDLVSTGANEFLAIWRTDTEVLGLGSDSDIISARSLTEESPGARLARSAPSLIWTPLGTPARRWPQTKPDE